MESLEYIKPKQISLKNHPELNETWVQNVIVEDPSVLGLGDVIVKDKERAQPGGGKLDFLLQDSDSTQRYEVEIQLGKTDASHIIRTIEYWDIERKRYPQYEHCAVIVAEDITSRFLNVISLFNGAIPLMALQMSAINVGKNISLIFTTVLDQVMLGAPDEEEEAGEVADRSYWEKRGTKLTIGLLDEVFEIVKLFDPSLELKYNKFYIGLSKEGQTKNFVIFRPKKKFIRIGLRIPRDKELEEKIEESEIYLMDYSSRSGRIRVKLTKENIQNNREFVTELIKKAYDRSIT